MIIITRVFRKEMRGFSASVLNDLLALLRKHYRGLDTNIFEIQHFGEYLILKGYLQGKSVRIIVVNDPSGIYIPLALYKKESKLGYNIREDFDTRGHMSRMQKCLENDAFEIFSL